MKNNMKAVLSVFIALAVCICFSACAPSVSGGSKAGDDEGVSRTVYAMDISISLTAYGERAEEALEAAEDEIHRIDSLLSVTNEKSQIGMLNSRSSSAVSDETLDIISESLRMSELTDGSFDITVYPIVKAWGFTTGGKYRIPEESEISSLLSHVGMDRFTLSSEEGSTEGSISFSDPETMLDTGAITKGYASEKLYRIFDEYGVESAIVSLGGNILAKGRKTDGELWHVAVKDPADPDSSYAGIAAVEDRFLVTSGGYERYFEDADGRRYIHIMDPVTGHPVENDLASVTIVSGNGTEADALSTALFVKGLNGAVDFWKKTEDLDFDMILIDNDGKTYITEGLADAYEPAEGIREVITRG